MGKRTDRDRSSSRPKHRRCCRVRVQTGRPGTDCERLKSRPARSPRRFSSPAPDWREPVCCGKLDRECPCGKAWSMSTAGKLRYLGGSLGRSAAQKPWSRTDPSRKSSGPCSRRDSARHRDGTRSEERTPSAAKKLFYRHSSEASFHKLAEGGTSIRFKSINFLFLLNGFDFQGFTFADERNVGTPLISHLSFAEGER